MAKNIGRNTNVNDTASQTSVALNSTTATTVAAANASRMVFQFYNVSNKDVWLKLQAASVDNLKIGIFVLRGTRWAMPVDNMYTGEISAIADNATSTGYITEY